MKFIKKNYFWILIIVISIIRFLMSFNLNSFYLPTFKYDDNLMINELLSLIKGNYLGYYSDFTLIKGIFFPLVLYFINTSGLSYSLIFTLLYIFVSLYLTLSFKKNINKKYLLIIYIVLLFNPVTYSSELFQRLYRNSISLIELLFFLGTIINLINHDKNYSLDYILLGLIISSMYLTREDNLWTIIIVILLIGYKIYKNHKLKNIFICMFPFITLILCLNIVSFINYKNYGIYTYNELSKSEFKKAYIKILQIKDDKKIDKVAIPRSTFYKLADNSKEFHLTKNNIDFFYNLMDKKDKEINNADIVWNYRRMNTRLLDFKNGKDSEKYYHNLNKDIDHLFKKGVLKKELTTSSIFIYFPTINDIKKLPGSLINAVIYTSSYEDIKIISNKELKKYKYNEKVRAYEINYKKRYDTDKITKNNPLIYEIFRIIYKVLTIILSIPCLIIYLFNIKKKDKLNLILHMIVLIYIIIISGVAYTNVTAFPSIRYLYLGNIYILQSLFIILNIIRFIESKFIK